MGSAEWEGWHPAGKVLSFDTKTCAYVEAVDFGDGGVDAVAVACGEVEAEGDLGVEVYQRETVVGVQRLRHSLQRVLNHL